MPRKIYEVAKELDMGALDLVDALKDKGFNVRNHMSSLSDDEVKKVLEEFSTSLPKKEAGSASKKVKKKIVKKKVAKKAASSKDEESSENPEEKQKKKVVKRKTVVRRRSSSKQEDEQVLAEEEIENTSELQAVEEQSPSAGPEKTLDEEKISSPVEESSVQGLRIVSAPTQESETVVEDLETSSEKEDVVLEAASEEKEVVEKKKTKELYREKVHRFTPVFIPEKKEETSDDSDDEKVSSDGPSENKIASGDDDDESKSKLNSKKRIGGLASMMSGKKPVISRSQAINLTRAETELKSYASLSGTGRPIYTQVKKKRIFTGIGDKTQITDVKENKRVVKLHDGCTVEHLAKKLSIKLKELIDKCLDINLLIKNGDYVGIELANEIASLCRYRVENVAFDEEEVIGKGENEKAHDENPLRNPIITIMGHVDHGKTTLLDYIRNTKVVTSEAGGITQHMGAYSVDAKDRTLTFLDTPGHAAFANMRKRGADLTDIVVLVVAADDGVMPQTRESIRYCQERGVPLIVAINKMDKEGANPDRIKNELTEFHITPEDWGGETQFCEISALKGEGIDELLDSIALQAEILELRADPKGAAEGVVIESNIEQGRGVMTTVLIQSGTLKKGDNVVVGETFGRARSLTNHLGVEIKSAGPSIPVRIFGLNDCPSPGDNLNVVKNEREAKKIAENRSEQKRLVVSTRPKKKFSLEDFFATSVEEKVEVKQLKLIIRTDVQGTFEAIKNSLESLTNDEIEVTIISGGVGPITDSDVNLADSAGAYLLGFNMRPLTSARRIAENFEIEIKTYSVIYELINDVKLAMEGMLDPDSVEQFIGRAEVKEVFMIPKVGAIAGSMVIDGKIQSGCNIRLLRDGKILFDGKMSSLKRFKDDVKEVKNGLECGIALEKYNDIKVGDLFEAYNMIEKKRTLEDVEKRMAYKNEKEQNSAQSDI